MKTPSHFIFLTLSVVAVSVAAVRAQDDASRQLDSALKQRPIQADVVVDVPTASEASQCETQITQEGRGMIVLGPQKNVLRMFLDTDGDKDNRVDQWSYFHNGVEVYRENDPNASLKQDSFRWMNTAGTRWGVDADEDGVIDVWKEISQEELSREIVLALATNDEARFLRCALNEKELETLALGEMYHDSVAQKVAALKTGFPAAVQAVAFSVASAEKPVEWYQLNAVMPGLVPKSPQAGGKDLVVYENAIATVGDGDETKQISLGTLVKIGDNNWRTLDLPKPYDDARLSYTFIQPTFTPHSTGPTDSEVIALMGKVAELQGSVAALPADRRPARHKEVIEIMIQIIAKATSNEERDNWIEQLAEAIQAAVMANEFPQGSEQIKAVFEAVEKAGNNDELAAYVKSRQIMTDFYTAMNADQDNVKAYSQWLVDLENMVIRYEKTTAGVEGMMQLASNKEITTQSPDESVKWYTKVVEATAGKPADKTLGEKARGAIRRLEAPGKAVPFRTSDVTGKAFDVTALRGKVAVLCFWDSRSVPLLKSVKDVADKNGAVVVGVNVDGDVETMKASVAAAARNGIAAWSQLFSQGGLEGSNAVYWGIPSSPYLIVYGKDGKVLRSTLQTAEELNEVLSQSAK